MDPEPGVPSLSLVAFPLLLMVPVPVPISAPRSLVTGAFRVMNNRPVVMSLVIVTGQPNSSRLTDRESQADRFFLLIPSSPTYGVSGSRGRLTMCRSVAISRDPPGRSSQKATPVTAAERSQGLLCPNGSRPVEVPAPPMLLPILGVNIIGEDMLEGDMADPSPEGDSPSEHRGWTLEPV